MGTDAGFPAYGDPDSKSNCDSMAYGYQHTASLSNPDRDFAAYTNAGALSYSNCYADTNPDRNCDRD